VTGMRFLLNTRIFRLSLAIVVSLWMAGAGCLLGCSNSVSASVSIPKSETETVVANESCASRHSHDCCANKKQPQAATRTVSEQRTLHVQPLPPRMMEDCALAVSASAVVSKAGNHGIADTQPAVTSFTPAQLLKIAEVEPRETFLHNRGPTYLRCCVFLI